jgi:DNA-binding LytR/AlgR family response regulator
MEQDFPLNILIIEDEAPAVALLTSFLIAAEPKARIVGIPDSVEASVKWLTTHPPPDLIFMDIRLADGISFSIFEKVDVHAPVIFTTAYDEYAIRAFKVNSIDYLLKPLNADQVTAALKKFRHLHTSASPNLNTIDMRDIARMLKSGQPVYKSRFLIPVNEQFISIPSADIFFFTSSNKLTFAVTKEGKKYSLPEPLDNIEAQLDPHQFFRANRQFILHYSAITAVHSFFNGKLKVYMHGTSEEIIVSKEKATVFKNWMDT